MTGQLFEEHRDALLVDHDFSIFSKCAEGDLDVDAYPDRASDLELLLKDTVEHLLEGEEGADYEAVREALIYYVTDIWPLRREAGLDAGEALEIAQSAQVIDMLPQDIADQLEGRSTNQWEGALAAPTLSKSAPIDPVPDNEEETDETPQQSDQDEAPRSEEDLAGGGTSSGEATTETATEDSGDPSQDNVEDEQEPEPQNKQAEEQSSRKQEARRRQSSREFKEAYVNFDQICERIFNARDNGRLIVVMLGLETAGKTFFVRRLGHTLEDYTILNIDGRPANFGKTTDRTKGIVYYALNSAAETRADLKNAPHVDLFDLPGEWFRDLAGASSADSVTPEQKAQFCAILSAADLCVIVEPAMQVLAPDIYCESGDIAGELEIDDFIKDAKANGEPDPEAYARERAAESRLEHAELVEEFHDNFEAVRRRIFNLREAATSAIDMRDAGVMRSTIDEYLDQSFAEMKEFDGPLPIPGLLLLSRTDDYAVRATADDPDCAIDPAQSLAFRAKAKFKIYSKAFSIFGVDFITANRAAKVSPTNAKQARAYNKFADHGGIEHIIEEWMVPAIRTSRMTNSFARRLRSPQRALFWRQVFDGRFRKSWMKARR